MLFDFKEGIILWSQYSVHLMSQRFGLFRIDENTKMFNICLKLES